MDSFSESEQIPVNRVDEVPVKEGNQAQIESADKSLNLDDINHIIDDLDFSKVDLNLSFDVNVFEESGILAEETDSSNHLNETEKPLEIEGILEDPVESVKEEEKKMRFPRAINRLAVYYHPACMNHDIPRHPEQPKRVQYILRALQSHFQQNQNVSFRLATQIAEEKILLFHTNYVLQSFLKKWEECKQIYDKQKKIVSRNIDGDTEVMHGTKDAAYFAAGSIINAIDHVYLPKEDNLAVDTAFCCVRPPGHHAEPNKAGGFCFFNNAGIGALYAREKYNIKRVAVLDFDVHHGNGTEEGFKDDEDLFYGSTHQRYCYPGSGPDPTPFIGDKSKTPLQRRIVDRMLTPGESSRKEFYMKWIQVLQEMELFKPELIIISAGFDAHDDDPLADVELLDEDYRWATAEVLKSGLRVNPSSPPKVVSILEGGYDLGAISRSAVLHVQSLYDGYESVVEEIVKENERKQMENHEGDEVEALKDYLQDLGI